MTNDCTNYKIAGYDEALFFIHILSLLCKGEEYIRICHFPPYSFKGTGQGLNFVIDGGYRRENKKCWD